mmetsp:Transcript_23593/g.76246  ORF Transcript_23593/g.76246 Transcript_23593/m.76246 type:complete len:226 (-) Transcript_23593:361-1038(-)
MPPCHMCLVAALLSVAPAGAVTSKKDALDRRLQKGGSARVGGPATIASGGTNGSAYTAMMVWWCEKPERMETQECVRSKLYQQLRQTHDKEGNAIVLDRLKNLTNAVGGTDRTRIEAIQTAFCAEVDAASPVCLALHKSQATNQLNQWYCGGQGKESTYCKRTALMLQLHDMPAGNVTGRKDLAHQLSMLVSKGSPMATELNAARLDFCKVPDHRATCLAALWST